MPSRACWLPAPADPTPVNDSSDSAVSEPSPGARVVLAIRAWIAEGRLAYGGRLPPEESLAASLGVSRGTVRRAIRELTSMGVLAPVSKHQRRTISTPTRGILMRTCIMLSELPAGCEQDIRGYDDAVQLAIRDAAHQAGISLLHLHPSSCSDEGMREILQAPPLGVLAAHAVGLHPDGQRILRCLQAAGVPVVAHGNDPGLEGLDRVSSGHVQGTSDLVHWLAGQGRRRILRAWMGQARYWRVERDHGYQVACRALGLVELPILEIDNIIPRGDGPRDLHARACHAAGALAERFLTADPPDAVLATSDCDVFALAAACRRLGREPGRDVLVCGYDDYWATCWERGCSTDTPAATVSKANRRVGDEMFRMLLDSAAGAVRHGPRHVVVPQEVVAI